MTHEELLAEIGDNSERTNNALRAVMELHKSSYGDCECCHTGQYHGGVIELEPYPCTTIQAIEGQLK